MTEMKSDGRVRWLDHAIGAALALTYLLILVRTAHNLGYARDEGFYFDAGRSYAMWFQEFLRAPAHAMSREMVNRYWEINHEHPSVMKTLFGLSWLYLHEKHRVFTEAGTAFRFPGMVTGALSLWLVYAMGVRAYGRRAGAVAACALGLMPRVFYHSHLDCFDVPVMFFSTLVVYCYWRSLEGATWQRWLWAALTGIAWGVALDVKFNVFLLPVVFVIHWFVTRGPHAFRDGAVSFPAAVLFMATLGVATFVTLWPWMWFDTFVAEGGRPGRLGEYLAFHWNHPYYNIEYFGYNWFRPPFPRSYPYVMILITVPGVTLALFAAGVIVRFRHGIRQISALAGWLPDVPRLAKSRAFAQPRADDDRRGTDILFFGAGYAAIALWLKTSTPIFGGTKHWLTAYPFLALFAGAGFEAVSRALDGKLAGRVRPAWLPAAALGSVCALAPVALTTHSHPFGLSNYTPIAGGAPGAADLGMNRQFWGFTTGSVVDYLNDHLPNGGSVFIHDTAQPSWEMLRSDGRVRDNIRGSPWGVGENDYALVQHELHMNEVDFQIWQAFRSPAVEHVVTLDGVPIVSVYRNPTR